MTAIIAAGTAPRLSAEAVDATLRAVRPKESKTIPVHSPIGNLFDAAAQFATELRLSRRVK